MTDALLAFALTLLTVLLLAGFPGLPWLAYALALPHSAALALRRRTPVPAVGLGVATGLTYLVVGYPMVGLGVTGLVWAYTIGLLWRPPRSLVVHGVVLSGVAATMLAGSQGDSQTLVGNLVVLSAAYLLGDSARRRRDVLALHRDRADQLERTQAEVARRAVAEERLRIARELHDVVAHSMSVVAVQAGTGRLVIDSEPARAREALAVIERTSRDALDEMRRLLGVLRDDADGGAGRTPAPGLAALDELVARTVASGVPVSVRIEGERRPLPTGLELAAYRIVQEALTNVARHAPGAAATVVLTYDADTLGVEVTNTPSASRPATDGAGLGLIGMRERATLYGGDVTAEPVPDGGFVVRTTLRGER